MFVVLPGSTLTRDAAGARRAAHDALIDRGGADGVFMCVGGPGARTGRAWPRVAPGICQLDAKRTAPTPALRRAAA